MSLHATVSYQSVKGPSNSDTESYLFPMENQKKEKGRAEERGAEEGNVSVQRGLFLQHAGARKSGDTGCWSGDANIQFNNGILKKKIVVVVFKL